MADNNLEKFTSKNPLQQYFIKRFHQTIVSLAIQASKEHSVDTILDVGCGEGFTIRALQQSFPNATYTGIDPDENALSFAAKMDVRSNYVSGSIFNLPYPDNSFDIVLANEVLEHLTEPHKALTELIRVCKHSLILSVPHEPFFRLSNFIRGRNIFRLGNYPYHLNTWTKNSFLRFLSPHIELATCKTPFPWTLVLGHPLKK